MKEIQQLMRELKNYPSNFFAYESNQPDEAGQLIICNLDRETQGSIKVGDAEEIIIS